MTLMPSSNFSRRSSIAVEPIINALRGRVSWKLMRQALKESGLPIGAGWDALLVNATKKEEDKKPGKKSAKKSVLDPAKFEKFLQTYFSDSLLFGERYVQLFDAPDSITKDRLKSFTSLNIPNSTFSSKYPLPLTSMELSTAPSEPTLCEVRTLEKGDVAMIFCSSRSTEERNRYSYNQVAEDIQKTFGNFNELIAIQRIFSQAYDAIVFRPSLKRIDIYIDQPNRVSIGATIDELPLNLLTACSKFLPELSGISKSPPKNLFPAIADLYGSKREGVVMALSFRTQTGSIKKERMTDSRDLRQEVYHDAGMSAVKQNISPYEITLYWDFTYPVKGSATLTLNALVREISSATPTLHGCYIRSATSNAFSQALNKLVTYI